MHQIKNLWQVNFSALWQRTIASKMNPLGYKWAKIS